MKIVFFGTSSFAVPSLEAIKSGEFELMAVVTAPDRRGGRGRKKVIQSPVKKWALENGIECLQPPNLKADDFLNKLRDYRADIFVVVAFRMLPQQVWDMPPGGTVNLHASLLPSYRGAAPIHHAIMSGEPQTGMTVFQLRHQIDTGDILAQREIEILPDETTGELHDRMAQSGAEVLSDTLDRIADGTVKPKPQDDRLASPAPKISREISKIDFSRGMNRVHNLIRGLNPFPGAYAEFDGKELKIWKSSMNGNPLPAGKVDTDGKTYMRIGTGDGSVDCLEVQLTGKKRMTIEEFLNGYGHLVPGRFGSTQ